MTSATFTAVNISASQDEGSIIRNFEADEAGGVGDAVYITSAGKVKLADSNVDATPLAAQAIGIVTGVATNSVFGQTTFAAGDRVSVCIFGPVHGFSGLVEGTLLFSSKTAGDIEQTAQSASYQWALGYALHDDTIFVLPGMSSPVSA
jgi:hypothetical protein